LKDQLQIEIKKLYMAINRLTAVCERMAITAPEEESIENEKYNHYGGPYWIFTQEQIDDAIKKGK